jgi:hypothetical protein
VGLCRKRAFSSFMNLSFVQRMLGVSVSFLVFGFVAEVATESFGFQIWRL